jgi:hypothetical protein
MDLTHTSISEMCSLHLEKKTGMKLTHPSGVSKPNRRLKACLEQRVIEGIEGAIIPHYSKLSSRRF